MVSHNILNEQLSPWMLHDGPDDDIVMSTRIRLARNLNHYVFPTMMNSEEAHIIIRQMEEKCLERTFADVGSFTMLKMSELRPIERLVLVEKHLISPHLAENNVQGACLLSENEQISIMVNEEDHIRIQCLSPGFQLEETFQLASLLDDWVEESMDYAFDEKKGYLTSCPTNVGTGLRASVMMHLPGLVLTQQMKRLVPAINQFGFVVRGIYGEGSDALGNIFQISNQMTLGKSERDIIEDLKTIVKQIISQEKSAQDAMVKTWSLLLEDKVCRALGVLTSSRIIELKEAATCLSDMRLGIDLGYIQGISKKLFNELIILIQPGIVQQYAGMPLKLADRDIKRASFIRERIYLEMKREEDDI